jgi:predicted DNA-binding antitoxin AbrB/MazE fold protein
MHFEDGVLKPDEPLPLAPGQSVQVMLLSPPDPDRWKRWEAAPFQTDEEKWLTESGMEEWAEMLDKEDRGAAR